jgi:hypothetical protein
LTYEVQLHSLHVNIWVNIANMSSGAVGKLSEDDTLACPSQGHTQDHEAILNAQIISVTSFEKSCRRQKQEKGT